LSLLSCKDILKIKEVFEVSHARLLLKAVERDQKTNLGDNAKGKASRIGRLLHR
jgi:hypothetical protein